MMRRDIFVQNDKIKKKPRTCFFFIHREPLGPSFLVVLPVAHPYVHSVLDAIVLDLLSAMQGSFINVSIGKHVEPQKRVATGQADAKIEVREVGAAAFILGSRPRATVGGG